MIVTEREQKVLNMPVVKKGNVLVIEDDDDTADSICTFLKREGYGARWVSSRDEALEVLGSYIYDFIVMDYMMPGLGAVDFLKQARQSCPRSKFVLITAASIAHERAHTLGISQWLGKPFTPEALLSALQRFEKS